MATKVWHNPFDVQLQRGYYVYRVSKILRAIEELAELTSEHVHPDLKCRGASLEERNALAVAYRAILDAHGEGDVPKAIADVPRFVRVSDAN